MNDLFPTGLILFVSAMCVGAQTNATMVSNETNTTDRVEAEYEALLRLDDATITEVQGLVNQWQARQGADVAAVSEEELRKQVKFKLDTLKDAYERFLKANPHHVRAMIAYGSLLCDTHQEEEGIQWWQKARELDPQNAAVRNNLANHYGHNGQPGRAVEEYEAAIGLQPGEPVYQFNLANTLYLFRRDAAVLKDSTEGEILNRALECFRKARDLEPGNYDYASAYAETFYGLEHADWQRALDAWDYCLKLNVTPLQRDQIYTHLARIQLRLGNPAKARQHLELVRTEQLQDLRKRLTQLADQQDAAARPREIMQADTAPAR